jgi:hypothetical protein
VKIFLLTTLISISSIAAAQAHARFERPSTDVPIYVEPQDPSALPRRFRNHCGFDRWRGTYSCANHCGSSYQLYYCSPKSFGCCHVGFGHCDELGHVSCHP